MPDEYECDFAGLGVETITGVARYAWKCPFSTDLEYFACLTDAESLEFTFAVAPRFARDVTVDSTTFSNLVMVAAGAATSKRRGAFERCVALRRVERARS